MILPWAWAIANKSGAAVGGYDMVVYTDEQAARDDAEIYNDSHLAYATGDECIVYALFPKPEISRPGDSVGLEENL